MYISSYLPPLLHQAAAAPTSPGYEYMLTLPGVCAPTGVPGENFWDPFGFANSKGFSVSEAKRFREAEVTHGRVAMLATLGWVLQEEWHPIFPSEGGPAFRHFQEVEGIFPQFWEIVLIAIGAWELRRARIGWTDPKEATTKNTMRDEYNPGQIGFDPLGLFPADPNSQEAYDLQTKELNNGRLAMFAWAGFAAQEEVDHVTIWRGLVETHVVPPEDANLLPF